MADDDDCNAGPYGRHAFCHDVYKLLRLPPEEESPESLEVMIRLLRHICTANKDLGAAANAFREERNDLRLALDARTAEVERLRVQSAIMRRTLLNFAEYEKSRGVLIDSAVVEDVLCQTRNALKADAAAQALPATGEKP